MPNRFATLAAVCVLTPVGTAPPAFAEPDPPPPGVPVSEPPAGPMPSNQPGYLTTPDGCELTVAGQDESIEEVPALTGSPASREFAVDGTFTGSVRCEGS